jgi:hypothetical protein
MLRAHLGNLAENFPRRNSHKVTITPAETPQVRPRPVPQPPPGPARRPPCPPQGPSRPTLCVRASGPMAPLTDKLSFLLP